MAYEVEVKKVQTTVQKSIEQGIHFADMFVSKNYLINLGNCAVMEMAEEGGNYASINLLEVTKICYDSQENVQDKLMTVYSAVFNAGSSAILLLKSTETGVRFFLGCRDEKQPILSRGILEKSLKGNFPGIDISLCYGGEIQSLMEESFPLEYDSKSIASVSIVPGRRDEDKQQFVQGIEKFIDTMAGEEYTALFIADPVSKETLEQKKRGYEKLYTSLSMFANYTMAYGENSSQAVSESLTEGFSEAISEGVTDTVGTNQSQSKSKSRGSSHGNGMNFFGMNHNSGRNRGTSNTRTTGSSESHAATSTKTDSTNKNETKSTTDTTGSSITLTTTQQNKTVLAIMEKIDEQMKRIRESESFGLWNAACYFSSSDKKTTLTAANTFKALVSGEKTSVENSFVNIWSDKREEWEKRTSLACSYLRRGKHIRVNYQGVLIDKEGEEELAEEVVTPANLVSGAELPLLLGIPLKSVNGVSVITSAEFGRNVRYRSDFAAKKTRRTIEMGAIYHMGTVWGKNRVPIDIDDLSGHCFITGTTGSGKSNTTYKLLEELLKKNIKFLVIEPAKGEYKQQFKELEEINIFTTGAQYFEMLRLNPFEFPAGVHVAEHLQKLVQVFSACWPLYAAMPAILKNAFEKSYKYCGWDLHHSIHFDNGKGKYPTFHTLLKMLPEIINTSDYSADSKGDYKGSLLTRVESLTTGLIGDIISSGFSIPDDILFDANTIIDISRIKSDETVSVIMGVLIMKLNEYRMVQKIGKNSRLRHVTVLEEAHNILKRVSLDQNQESGNVQGQSVAMIRNSIAEMRTYGEGFVIIDQSPSEVDVSAIKNTNTKMIMKLSDESDFEAVGRTIGLSDEQILEIGKLRQGVAVMYQTDWEEPVLTMIDPCSGSYENNDLEENDRSEEQNLLGEILTELMEQKETGDFNISWINSIMNSYPGISDMKKRLYRNQIFMFKKSAVNANQRQLNRQFSELIFGLAGCGDLFEIFSLEIPVIPKLEDLTEEIGKMIVEWSLKMKGAMNQYFKANEECREKVLRYILMYKGLTGGENRYKAALKYIMEH